MWMRATVKVMTTTTEGLCAWEQSRCRSCRMVGKNWETYYYKEGIPSSQLDPPGPVADMKPNPTFMWFVLDGYYYSDNVSNCTQVTSSSSTSPDLMDGEWFEVCLLPRSWKTLKVIIWWSRVPTFELNRTGIQSSCIWHRHTLETTSLAVVLAWSKP